MTSSALRLVLTPLPVAVAIGAVVGVAQAGRPGVVALLLVPVVLLLADVAGVLVAIAVGLDPYRLQVGEGKDLRSWRVRNVRVVLHAVPTCIGWNGRVRGPRLVRLRFAVAHASTLSVLVGAGVATWQQPVLRGGAATVLLIAATSFLPWTDGAGRSATGRSVLVCCTAPDAVIDEWWQTRAGGAAYRAARAGRHEQAIALATAVLAQDPADRAALEALATSADDTGDTSAALRAAELTWSAARRAPTIAVAANYAWALVRARESGVAPADWSPRVRGALAEVDRLGGDGWEIDGTRALFAVLSGRPADAVEHLERPLRSSADADDRASELLTLALACAASGDRDGEQAAVQEAERCSPDHPRLPVVRRLLAADGEQEVPRTPGPPPARTA